MGFSIYLYNNFKNKRSTATPGTAALQFADCLLREGCSVQRPTIGIDGTGGAAWNPSSYNYAYINAFSRYYWITDWTWQNGLWWCSLRVDVLTTARGAIGSSELYVLRSSYSWDGRISDSLYPVKTQATAKQITLPQLWQPGSSTGMYIAQIACKTGVNIYVMTPAQWYALTDYLYSDAYYDAVLTSLSIDMYPEAKIALDPMQFILSVKYIPAPFKLPSSTDWALNYIDASSVGVRIGTIQTSIMPTGVILRNDSSSITRLTQTFELDSSDLQHPLASERGEYLNFPPYTRWYAYIPPFGSVELDSGKIAKGSTLFVTQMYDLAGGTARLNISATTTGTGTLPVADLTVPIGLDVPVAHVQAPGVSPTSLLQSGLSAFGGAVGSVLTLNPVGLISSIFGGATSAVRDMAEGDKPVLSSTGGISSQVNYTGIPHLTIVHYTPVDDDLEDNGRPLCQIRRLSTIPGYIVCDPTGFTCGLTDEETAEIQQYMREGFFYA